jgi:cysteinyl-tRNA synthetase
MKIYNTLSHQLEEFTPINPPHVGMYTCGMTVYDFAHIGHGRKYVNDDILKRVLTYNGYKVKHVQNVTDVGHLVSDADEGEDKLEKGARNTGKTVWEVAKFYTDHFYKSMDLLNITRPDIICKATEHIPEQIELVRKLVEKGYAYDTPEAVYFDISKFADYGKLSGGQNISEKKVAAREEVEKGLHKKNPADFALWFKRVGKFSDHIMHWDSPWGEGFPGWHIECSAMSMKYLGETFDIHTGGIDHLSVHHPNEIAQSEAAIGKKFVNYWLHSNFLMVDGEKMSKSLQNIYTVEQIIDRGYDPLALRYLFLQTHYRQEMNFSFEALEAAQNALNRLRREVASYGQSSSSIPEYEAQFLEAINDDLNMPKSLSILWEVVRSNRNAPEKAATVFKFDEVLGLSLKDAKSIMQKERKVPEEVQKMLEEREKLRKEKKFTQSDKIREKIIAMGYKVEDPVDRS